MRIILLAILLNSCSSYLPKDIAPNYAINNFNSIEMEVSVGEYSIKEYGISNILLNDSNINNTSIKIKGIKTGTLKIFSNECSLNINTNFNEYTYIKISDLLPYPMKCSIGLLATTDPINGKQHQIVETGLIKVNTLSEKSLPISISYFQQNSLGDGITDYNFIGQGSMQRVEGYLTSSEKINISSESEDGGIYRVNGCGHESSFDIKSFLYISFRYRLKLLP